MRNWGTMLESHGEGLKQCTMKKSQGYAVHVSCKQFFDFFMVLGGYTLASLLHYTSLPSPPPPQPPATECKTINLLLSYNIAR